MPRKQQVKKQAAKRKRQAEEEVIEEPLPTCPIEKDVIQVTKMVQDAVDRGYGIEGPASMLNMLKAVAPKALVDFKEDRSRWQTEMVRILGSVITSIKTKMDTSMAEMTSKQATADETRAALSAAAETASNDKAAKEEEFNTRKNHQKEMADNLKTVEKTLAALQKSLETQGVELTGLEAAKASLEEVFNVHWKFLITEPEPVPEPVVEPIVEEAVPAPVPEAEAAPAVEAPVEAPVEGAGILETPVEAPVEAAPMEVEAPAPEPVVEEAPPAPEPELPKLTRKESKKIVLKKLAELKLEAGCFDTLKMVLNKLPSEYSGFDKSTIEYANTWILKRIMAFTQSITDKNAAIALTNTEITAGKEAEVKATDEKVYAIEDLHKALEAKSAATNLWKDATKAIKTHDQEHKEMADRMKKATIHLGEYDMCVMCFNRLVDRSAPPPPPVVEEAAPEPIVEMAAPPADVEMAA